MGDRTADCPNCTDTGKRLFRCAYHEGWQDAMDTLTLKSVEYATECPNFEQPIIAPSLEAAERGLVTCDAGRHRLLRREVFVGPWVDEEG